MYKKLKRKIVISITLSVFALMAILLSIINVSNFIGAAEAADHITERIERNGGSLSPDGQGAGPGKSDEGMESIHYFVYNSSTESFDKYNMMTISNEYALSWAKRLVNGAAKGWTEVNYRYRVYTKKDVKYVVVIDQSRELSPNYRILYISLITGAIGLIGVSVIAMLVSKKIVQPFEENDNKQKRFIADAARALKNPISVISLDTVTIEKDFKENESTKSIKKEVRKLLDLSNDLNSLNSAELNNAVKSKINLSNVLKDTLSLYKDGFDSNHKSLDIQIQDDIELEADDGMMRKMFSELIENSLKYADSAVKIALNREDSRIQLILSNNCKNIPEGTLDRVFDKFYRLDYKDHSIYEGNGVGLSIVKEIVDIHKGRVIAKGQDNNFIIKIEF